VGRKGFVKRSRPGVGRRSAGLLLYRRASDEQVEVLIGHMGGPYWLNRDDGAWSIPKGEYEPGEEPLAAARREFQEEIGQGAPAGEPCYLGEVAQSGGKRVRVWALDVSSIEGNTFEAEWPPRSGRMQRFPEIDRAAWFDLQTAPRKLVQGQRRFLELLIERLHHRAGTDADGP